MLIVAAVACVYLPEAIAIAERFNGRWDILAGPPESFFILLKIPAPPPLATERAE